MTAGKNDKSDAEKIADLLVAAPFRRAARAAGRPPR